MPEHETVLFDALDQPPEQRTIIGGRLAVAAACIREKRDLACQQRAAGKARRERQTGIGGARTGISSETARPRRGRAARA